MDDDHKQIRFNPALVPEPYRTFRPKGAHPNPAHWESIRQQALERDNHQCRGCPVKADEVIPGLGKIRLEVHHRHYDNWGREELDDVTTFCKGCHQKITDHFMEWRDRGRVIEARGADATTPEGLPVKPKQVINLPSVQTTDYGSLPAAQKQQTKLPVHKHFS